MRKLVSYILILLLLVQANMRWLLTTAYRANKNYIAQNLCENRKYGDIKCEGKCFLKKQTKKAEKSEQEERQKGKEVTEMHGTVRILFPEITVALLDQAHRDAFKETHSQAPIFAIFHPPSRDSLC